MGKVESGKWNVKMECAMCKVESGMWKVEGVILQCALSKVKSGKWNLERGKWKLGSVKM